MRIWIAAALVIGALAMLLTGALRAGPDDPAVASSELDAKALAELALEHSRARDELLAAEARLALLAEKLFGSRLTVDYRGELDTPYRLAAIELHLDGALAFHKQFDQAPTAQALKLFDGYLPEGRHVVELRLTARGPDEPADDLPGYSAGAGMAVHLRPGADTRLIFEAEQDGNVPDRDELKGNEPDGSWEVEIQARFSTRPAR